ncbi:MAG: D-amino-acid transaminase [Rhodospirillales bacterium]
MTRIVYLNGAFVPADEAKVSIFDRGLLFADGIYEVCGVLDGKLTDFDGHVRRMERSLGEIDQPMPLTGDEISGIMRELIQRNNFAEGMIYMQVNRGAAERDFVYDNAQLTQTVFMFHQEKPLEETKAAKIGIAMASVPDLRWKRRDIKSVALLPQVLAKQAAKNAGAAEALMVMDDGTVSEGGSSSFYFIKDETIVTRPLSKDILPGITRRSLLDLAQRENLKIEERTFTLAEALAADEAFITAASTMVCPVVEIDGNRIGGGQPGPMTAKLRKIYFKNARETAV